MEISIAMSNLRFEYEPDSFAELFDEATYQRTARYRFGPKSIIGGDGYQIDAKWIDHLRKFNGGRPIANVIETVKGIKHPIGQMLNFSADCDELHDYHVEMILMSMGQRITDYLIPFAITSFGDVVCFDYGQVTDGRPAVVMWYHEKSRDFDPYTEYIAPNFDEFMNLLRPSEYDESDT